MEKSGVVSFPEYISSCYEDKLNELLLTGIDGAVEVIQGTTELECKILWEDPEDHNLVEGQFVYSRKVHFEAEDEEGFTHEKVMSLTCKLTVWAYFSDDGIEISIDRLGKYAKWPFSKHDIILDHYLVPKLDFKGISAYCDRFIAYRFPKEYAEKSCVSPQHLAKELRLKIVRYDLMDKDSIRSLLTNAPTILFVNGSDKKSIYPVVVEPDTIVLNTHIQYHKMAEESCIAHECFHYIAHRKFTALQKAATDKKIVLPITPDRIRMQEQSLYWIEKQAFLGAGFLRYPMRIAEADAVSYIFADKECINNDGLLPGIRPSANIGDKREQILSKISQKRKLPISLIRRILILSGDTATKGAYAFVNKKHVPAFEFDTSSCKGSSSYTISLPDLVSVCLSNQDLMIALAHGYLVYVEGHVCINSAKYVQTLFYEPPVRPQFIQTDKLVESVVC